MSLPRRRWELVVPYGQLVQQDFRLEAALNVRNSCDTSATQCTPEIHLVEVWLNPLPQSGWRDTLTNCCRSTRPSEVNSFNHNLRVARVRCANKGLYPRANTSTNSNADLGFVDVFSSLSASLRLGAVSQQKSRYSILSALFINGLTCISLRIAIRRYPHR